MLSWPWGGASKTGMKPVELRADCQPQILYLLQPHGLCRETEIQKLGMQHRKVQDVQVSVLPERGRKWAVGKARAAQPPSPCQSLQSVTLPGGSILSLSCFV